MADGFHSTIDALLSPNEYRMRAAAGAWTALAGAATQSNDRLRSISEDATAEPGVGLVDLAERLDRVGGWGADAGAVALTIARQLQVAGDGTAQIAEAALDLEREYAAQEEARDAKAEDAANHGWIRADQGVAMHSGRMAQLADRADGYLDELNSLYAMVTGGNAPAAPEVGSASGGAPGGGAPRAAGAGADGLAQPASYVGAPNGSQVGAGSYPHSSIVGPESGDFAGWVRSPGTGYLVDPATGREFDTVSGRWIDPVTGRPFGEVTEYATRLAGLGGGPGPLAGPAGVGLAAVGGGGGGPQAVFGGLYGGTVPPGIAHAGPARQQVARQAAQHLGRRADVAARYAAREAAQGGRPYVPPPGAGASGGAPGRQGASTGVRRPAPAGAPASTWRPRAADAAARHRLTGPTPPPAPGAARSAARTERSAHAGRRTDLTEDPAVWRPRGQATGGVLGE